MEFILQYGITEKIIQRELESNKYMGFEKYINTGGVQPRTTDLEVCHVNHSANAELLLCLAKLQINNLIKKCVIFECVLVDALSMH